ncbi:MAG: hypothetical protein ABFS42_03060 [Candidatus Krumholzibacteriota bacterium]
MNRNYILLVAGVLLALYLLAGCSNEDSELTAANLTGGDDYEQLDLGDPYGGLTASDEEVAFGDEGLKAMLLAEEQEVVDDPTADNPLVREMEERSRNMERYTDGERPRFTFLRLRWGMLRGPDDSTTIEPPCDVTDWTGTIRTDRGLVVVKRMIKFEFPADHVVFPRLNPQTVAFISRTTCHYDGLLIQIIEPPLDPSTEPEVANKLYIDMPLYQGEFLVSDLVDMDQVIDVDDQGNRIQLNGFGLDDIEICPKGFLSGRYRHMRQDRPDTVNTEDQGERLGVFAGAWITLNGRIHGFMRGGYGVTAEGERVFVGKFIDRQGRFMGLMRGGWDPAGEEGDLGEFRGAWVTRNGNVEGLLGGRAHPVPGYPGGFYEGRWTTLCDDEAEDLVQ